MYDFILTLVLKNGITNFNVNVEQLIIISSNASEHIRPFRVTSCAHSGETKLTTYYCLPRIE